MLFDVDFNTIEFFSLILFGYITALPFYFLLESRLNKAIILIASSVLVLGYYVAYKTNLTMISLLLFEMIILFIFYVMVFTGGFVKKLKVTRTWLLLAIGSVLSVWMVVHHGSGLESPNWREGVTSLNDNDVRLLMIYCIFYVAYTDIYVLIRAFLRKGGDLLRISMIKVMMPVLVVIIMLAFYIMANRQDTQASDIVIYGSFSLAIIASFYVFSYMLMVIGKRSILQLREKEDLLQLEQAKADYFSLITQQKKELRTFQHELRNRVQLIVTLINGTDEEKEKAKQLTGELCEQLATPIKLSYCENEIANAVLAVKLAEIAAVPCPFEASVAIPTKLPLSDYELCSVLSNMLDNALRAVSELPEETRIVKIKAQTTADTLIIKCVNSYQGEIVKKEGVLQTTKPDAARHGIGVELIKDIVKAHDGEFYINTDNNYFTIQTVFRLQ